MLRRWVVGVRPWSTWSETLPHRLASNLSPKILAWVKPSAQQQQQQLQPGLVVPRNPIRDVHEGGRHLFDTHRCMGFFIIYPNGNLISEIFKRKKERKKEEGLLVDVDVCFVTHVKWIDVAWRRPSKCGLIPSPPRSNNEDKRLLLNLRKKTSGERERERKSLWRTFCGTTESRQRRL